MIIDVILDREDDIKNQHIDLFSQRKLHDIYTYAMQFDFQYLSKALDYGDEKDIKEALCKYIDENEYNPSIKGFINSVNWLDGIPEDWLFVRNWEEFLDNLETTSTDSEAWDDYNNACYEVGKKSGLLRNYYDFYKSDGNLKHGHYDEELSDDEIEDFIHDHDIENDYRQYLLDSNVDFEKYVPFKKAFGLSPKGVLVFPINY